MPAVTTAVQVAAGVDHSCVLLMDGTLRCFGYDRYGQIQDPATTGSNRWPTTDPGLMDVAMVVTGDQFTLALLSNLEIWGFGRNLSGRLMVRSGASAPVQGTW